MATGRLPPGGAEGDGVRSQPPELDRGLGERVPQRVLAGRGHDGGQHPLAEQQARPAADDDPLGVEQVDEVGNTDADVEGGLVEQLGGWPIPICASKQCLQSRFFVFVRWTLVPRHLDPPFQDGAGADICLQASIGPAATVTAANYDRRVTQLTSAGGSAAIERTVSENGSPDAGSQKHDCGMAHAAPGTEPHLGLPHCLGAVVDQDR